MAQEEDDRFNYNIFDMLKKLEDEEDEESEERGNESLRNLINPKRKHEETISLDDDEIYDEEPEVKKPYDKEEVCYVAYGGKTISIPISTFDMISFFKLRALLYDRFSIELRSKFIPENEIRGLIDSKSNEWNLLQLPRPNKDQSYTLFTSKPFTSHELLLLLDQQFKQFPNKKHDKKHFYVENTFGSLSFDNLCKSKAETVSLYQLWESGNVSQQVLLSRDYEERATLNHFRALKYLEENASHEFTEELVCKVHELVLGESMGTVGELSGEYRRNSIYVGGLNCPSWELVPSLVNELIKYVQRGPLKENPAKFVAEFYYRFSAINPFWDGNGRTGRLLGNFLLQKYKFPPIFFDPCSEHYFINVINEIGDSEVDIWENVTEETPMDNYWLWSAITEKTQSIRSRLYELWILSVLDSYKRNVE